MVRTYKQQLAETLAKAARIRVKVKASETRRKIILGSVMISEALTTPDDAARLADLIRRKVTRDVDLKEFAELLADLDAKAGKA
jgi:hypothetical protein